MSSWQEFTGIRSVLRVVNTAPLETFSPFLVLTTYLVYRSLRLSFQLTAGGRSPTS